MHARTNGHTDSLKHTASNYACAVEVDALCDGLQTSEKEMRQVFRKNILYQ